ncbi:hypothetical protein GPECTOR_58g581 [Gonium pectorale]|uniref:Uncharacterized protein n=1 Tax=Gonium pectorale TaxID=33097 RepID=A0A150G5K1_GONPE|nr:hypothetical protein GPECTOR_58g581 [Gonium pectorale]|eukprot:KXZ45132.1 hypothetical protein GPECTOR_58g581 [Gonium pectorale]
MEAPAVQRLRWELLEQVAASVPAVDGGGGGGRSGEVGGGAGGLGAARSALWPLLLLAHAGPPSIGTGRMVQLEVIAFMAAAAAVPGWQLPGFGCSSPRPAGSDHRTDLSPGAWQEAVALAARVMAAFCAHAKSLVARSKAAPAAGEAYVAAAIATGDATGAGGAAAVAAAVLRAPLATAARLRGAALALVRGAPTVQAPAAAAAPVAAEAAVDLARELLVLHTWHLRFLRAAAEVLPAAATEYAHVASEGI